MSRSCFEVRDACLRRGQRPVLDAITASFETGCWTAIVGPNGAGKSTFLAVLAGLLPTDSGAIWLDGKLLHAWPARARARRIAWLAQDASLAGDLAGRDVVRLGRLPNFGHLGSPGPDDEAAVDAAMADTDALAFANRRIEELSGGERQRVLLARAFASSADVLLLDEPTVHLDAPHQRRLVDVIRRRTGSGTTVISVLHDLTLALAADRILVLCDGRVVAEGSPDETALRAALARVFDDAIAIDRFGTDGRWAAVPLV